MQSWYMCVCVCGWWVVGRGAGRVAVFPGPSVVHGWAVLCKTRRIEVEYPSPLSLSLITWCGLGRLGRTLKLPQIARFLPQL